MKKFKQFIIPVSLLVLIDQTVKIVISKVFMKFEFDIIAKNDTHIVFAEVKTRHTYPDIPHKFGRPASAVNYDKKHKLIEGAKKYLKKHKTDVEGLMCRIDIIEVYVSPDSEKYKVLKIIHMPNAVRGS